MQYVCSINNWNFNIFKKPKRVYLHHHVYQHNWFNNLFIIINFESGNNL